MKRNESKLRGHEKDIVPVPPPLTKVDIANRDRIA
jgi:hypothetical protein